MINQKLKVLITDDEPALRQQIIEALDPERFSFQEANNGLEAITNIKEQNFDLVLLDVCMPGGLNGLEVLKSIKKHNAQIIVIILTAYSSVKDAVEAIREGAFNYLEKPINDIDLIKTIDQALEAHSLITNIAFSAPILKVSGQQSMVGHSNKMQRIFALIDKLAEVDTSVLIRGENGTGKELVARAIHFNSLRKNHSFVPINCGAIPENLMESEFFGHEKGAFTGAVKRSIGKIQYASGGTLFLDEIGELPINMQVKLLRVLQEKTFIPVGSNRELKADVRIIAATNQHLEDMIKKGSFREDLFYRLNVLPVFLPPLRERIEDIPVLIERFIRVYNHKQKRSIEGVVPEALELLKSYSWPGNIRELENVVEMAFVLENSKIIQIKSLPADIQNVGLKDKNKMDFIQDREDFEKNFIIQVLRKFKGKINKTSQLTNIPKNTLLRKIKKYKITPKDYE